MFVLHIKKSWYNNIIYFVRFIIKFNKLDSNINKIILAMLVLGLSVFIFNNKSLAQTPEPALPQIHVINLNLSDLNPKAGDAGTGTFTLLNNSGVNVSDESYLLVLAGNYQNRIPTVVYDEKILGKVSLSAGEQKPVNFSYKLPANIAGNLGIRIQTIYAGSYMGWADSVMKVSGESSVAEITDSKLVINGVSYAPETGPAVPKGKTVSLQITFFNPTNEILTFQPNVSIYNRIETSDHIKDFTGDAITLAPQKSVTSTIALPTFENQPLVYAGTVRFLDNNGLIRAPQTTFRYMILGDIASILSVTSNKETAQAGDNIAITVFYAGAPFDQYNVVSSPKVGVVDLRVVLSNEKGQKIGETVSKLDLDKNGKSQNVVVTANVATTSLIADTTIEKNGVILSKNNTIFSTSLTPRDEPNTENVDASSASFIAIIFVFVIAIIILMVIKKKKGQGVPPGSALNVFAFLLIGGTMLLSSALSPAKALAYVQTEGANSQHVFLNSPYDNQVMTPGQQFYFDGRVDWTACNNTTNGKLVTTIVYQGKTYSYDSGLISNTGPKDASDYYSSSFSYGPFVSPSTPGTYRIPLDFHWYSYYHGGSGIMGSWSKGYVDIVVQGASVVMSGTLAPVSPSCVIASGASSCTVNLNWSITNPVAIPTTISATGMTSVNVSNTLTTPQSGVQSVTVPWGGRTFHLYNNLVQLATSTISSSSVTCTAGTSWNGTSCQTSVSVNGVLGTAAGKTGANSYPYGSTIYAPYTQCLSGTSSNTAFPTAGTSVSWTCLGSNGGTNSPVGTASQATLVLVPIVTISANPTSGNVNVVNPTITLSATNTPTSCTAR